VSDIDTAAADSLKVLDPKRPIREADVDRGAVTIPDFMGTHPWCPAMWRPITVRSASPAHVCWSMIPKNGYRFSVKIMLKLSNLDDLADIGFCRSPAEMAETKRVEN
jgi:hypothetical protein